MGKKAEKKRLHKSKRTKSFLAFDEDARKEWLTTFSKRKKERQAKAKEDLVALLKEEKTRQKEEFRENMKKNEAKYLEKIKDVEEILKEKTKAYECGDKMVEITEYSLCDQEDMIGTNKGEEEQEEEGSETNQDAEGEDKSESESDTEETNEPTLTAKQTKMPKKMSKVAVKIEKRLFKLNNKRKITKHAANKKKQQMEAAGKTPGKGKHGAKGKSKRKR